MANNLNEFDQTAGSNTDIGGVSIAEGMPPGSVNDALRMLCAHLAGAFNSASPAVKLNGVKTAKLTIADDTDQIAIGTSNPTTISHEDAANKTTIAAPRSIEIQIGDGTTEGTFTLNEHDSTLGEIEVVKQTNDGGLVVGNDALNTQRAADTTWRTMTVKGGLAATKFYGDGSGLTGVGSANGVTPVGLIAMWSGAAGTIPTGWALCNGQNGTPNLIDKFVMGAATAGATGGTNNKTLAANEVPAHTHGAGSLGNNHTHGFSNVNANHSHPAGSLTVNSHNHDLGSTSHRHSFQLNKFDYLIGNVNSGLQLYSPNTSSNRDTINTNNQTAGSSTDSESPDVSGSTGDANLTISGNTSTPTNFGGTTAANTGGQAFDNRPAFYTLAFIMFQGA